MKHPAVDNVVAEQLLTGNTDAQIAALDAISVREPSAALGAALQHAALSAADPRARMKAVEIMGQWLPKRPELRESLAAVAEKDTRSQVRQAAKHALGS